MTARILIIAGSDSGGGAGIQADIKTVTMLGGHAMTAITAITAQNTLGVQAVHPVPTAMVIAQMASVIDDIGVDAVKIGMVGSAETAMAVADYLATLEGVPIVFDPVMVATSGSLLADVATIAAFERLMALATLVTPNTPELEALSARSINDEISLQDAAHTVMERTRCRAVLAKGGHLMLSGRTYGKSPDGMAFDHDNAKLVFDFLYREGQDGWREHQWFSPRIDTPNTHGTGCTLASAIATGLGQGMPLPSAIDRARRYVRASLQCAPGLGSGHGPMGVPLGFSPDA
jgi:hydroxymethylpyrimidine/phosphomethylpyrimidine kinase